MVGGLFGRSEWKYQIDQLERTVGDLREKLEKREQEAARAREREQKEKERRREAVTARQTADEQVHRLEQRIAGLEGDLKRLQEQAQKAGADTGVAVRHHEAVHDQRLAVLLDRLASFQAPKRGAFTMTVHDGVPDGAARVLGPRAALLEPLAPCLLLMDDAGIVSLALRPPLMPAVEPVWEDRFVLEREWFEPSGRFALVLARSDLFAAGTYEGGQQVAFKGFKARVGRKHSRGGFSQGRFERIRDEQIADHIKRCREALHEFLEMDERVILVGQRETMDALASGLDPVAQVPVDATGAPRDALEDAFARFWTTQIWVL